jgi:hypothetical protein
VATPPLTSPGKMAAPPEFGHYERVARRVTARQEVVFP